MYGQFWENIPQVGGSPGGYSLYSDNRDDCHIFLRVVIGDLVFSRGCSRKIL